MTDPYPIPPGEIPDDQGHAYTSTACWHQLHLECRKTCKWCIAPCLCPCHASHPGDPE
jgi:hypothetical protein